MDSSDDIALGAFSAADLSALVGGESDNDRSRQREKSLKGIRRSFALSACVHLVLASSALYFIAADVRVEEDMIPGTLRVEFVAANPLLGQAEQVIPQGDAEDSSDTEDAVSPISTDVVESISLASIPVQLENAEAEILDVVETEVAEAAIAHRPVPVTESIAIPSIGSVHHAIEALRRSDASQFFTYDCNKIEEEREFNKCAPQDTRNYSSLAKNPVYDFYNPAAEISRSGETVTTLARHSGSVSAALAGSNLPAGLSAYVLEEIEQGIEIYSNESSRVVSHMNTMVDKSAAGALSRSIFDHWVVQQSALLKERRIENKVDAQLGENCKSYQKFIMAAAEYARACVSR